MDGSSEYTLYVKILKGLRTLGRSRSGRANYRRRLLAFCSAASNQIS